MITIPLEGAFELRSLQQKDAQVFLDVLEENRSHLDAWLRWSSPIQSLDLARDFIRRFESKELSRDGCHLGIWQEDELCGGVVSWGIDQVNKVSETGYWLAARHTGKGLATKGSLALMVHLFNEMDVNRIEMQCGVSNSASRAVAERCGLQFEGIRRQSHWVTNRFVDHAVYAQVKTDYAASATAG